MMTTVIATVWIVSLIGVAASLVIGQYIGAFTMLMNLILATIMLVERFES